jgi:hypothetical protein
MLKFSPANAKLNGLASIKAFVEQVHHRGTVYSFDLPAGYTCPGAKHCKSQAVPTTEGWKIRDGKYCQFRCYSASQEVVLPNVRNMRASNLKTIYEARTTEEITGVILHNIPPDCTILRIHASGDFFSQAYFDAWLAIAKARPDILFYAYTKTIKFWIARKKEVSRLSNFRLVASLGGKHDRLAERHRFRTCEVVLSYEEADEKRLPIDHDDSIACGIRRERKFATLIHGTQPEGSVEGRAVYKLRKAGKNGYRRSNQGYGVKKKGGK